MTAPFLRQQALSFFCESKNKRTRIAKLFLILSKCLILSEEYHKVTYSKRSFVRPSPALDFACLFRIISMAIITVQSARVRKKSEDGALCGAAYETPSLHGDAFHQGETIVLLRQCVAVHGAMMGPI